MENKALNIEQNGKILKFEVAEYLHHEAESCRFEVYRDGKFVAGFEPDKHGHLQICRQAGILEVEILYLVADKLELLQYQAKPF